MTTTPAALPDDADRILLVDDEATNLDVLRHALEGRGYRLFVARSGETAIEVARRVHPQLILLAGRHQGQGARSRRGRG